MKNKGLLKMLSALIAVAMVICAAPLNGFVGLEFPEIRISEMFDFGVNAVAAPVSYETIEENQTITVYASGYSQRYIKLVPKNTTTYTLVSVGNSDTYGFLYNENMEQLAYNDDGAGNRNFKIEYNLQAGETYYYGVRFYRSSYSGPITVKLTHACEHIVDDSGLKCETCGFEFLDIQVDMGQAKIISCNSFVTGSITLPSSYNGYPVILVAKNAFRNCTNITSVSVPESVITIEKYAFYGCTALESISLPDSALKIGESAFTGTAFYNDESNWEDNVLYIGKHLIKAGSISGEYTIKDGTKTIAEYAFQGRGRLTSVIFPESVLRISKCAFSNCAYMTAVSLNDGIQVIDTNAFFNCIRLSDVSFPDSINRIGVNVLDSTAYYENSSNWEDNILYNGKHLISSKSTIEIKEGTKTIAGKAFSHCYNLGNNEGVLTIPDSVVYIGAYAFEYCSGLVTVVIPDSVVDVQGDAFKSCTSLKNVTLSNSLKQIRKNTFQSCTALQSIDISDGVEYIGIEAFNNCSSLREIALPSSLKTIYSQAFYNNAFESVELPEGLKEIKEYAFGYCQNLNNISLPGTVEQIEDNILYYCVNVETLEIPFVGYQRDMPDRWRYLFGYNLPVLKNVTITNMQTLSSNLFRNNNVIEKVTLGDGVETIDEYAFSNCASLSDVTLANGIKTIGRRAFEKCTSLTSIVIPDSVDNIQDAVFYNCTSLKTVDLGNGADMAMSYDVFNGCTGLERFTIGSSNVNYSTDANGVLYNKNKTGLIKYPAASSITEYTISSSTAYVNEYAFENAYNIKKVNFPENIMSIGSYAFRNCTALEEVNIPDGASTICHHAFSGCSSVKKVVLPESLIILGGCAFADCVKLSKIIINCADLQDANSHPFCNCGTETEGTSVEFTDKVKSIPNDIFGNDYYSNIDINLKTLTIGKNVSYISSGVFNNCDNLIEVRFNAIDCNTYESMFEGCNSLDVVNIGDGVKVIPPYFLQNVWSIDKVVIPETVTSIGRYAFAECGGIDEFNLPSSLASIGDNAFYGCNWLYEITIPETVTSIGDYAFSSCNYLNDVVFIGKDEYDIGVNIFEDSPKATVCCKENSYMHSYAATNGMRYCIFDDSNNPNFEIRNGVLISYKGDAENLFLDSVSQVGYGAFSRAYSLENIELSNNIDRIFDKAFENCWSLETIIIPKSVTSIGDNAFDDCESVTIYCYAGSYAETYAKEHSIKYEYITLDLSKANVEIYSNEAVNLGALYNVNIVDTEEILWSSDNESIVKVAQNGKLIAVGTGTATISAKTESGLEAFCVVTVKAGDRPVDEIVSIPDFTVSYKGTTKIDADVKLDGVGYRVDYYSSDPSVVTVDENGNVTAVGTGDAEITVKITDEFGNVTEKTCKVTISYTWWQWLIIIFLFGWIWY